MTEFEEMEAFNAQFNQKMAERPVQNMITCPECQGRGGFYSCISSPESQRCWECLGKKYVPSNSDRLLPSEMKKFFITISELPQDHIDELNKVNS